MILNNKANRKITRIKPIPSLMIVSVLVTILGLSIVAGSIEGSLVFAQQFGDLTTDLQERGVEGLGAGNMSAVGNMTQTLPPTTDSITDGESGDEGEGDGGNEGEEEEASYDGG